MNLIEVLSTVHQCVVQLDVIYRPSKLSDEDGVHESQRA